ncbi:BnaC03g66020D [Brassica napus]|uniref:BnaC03g66020D protein n=2 Tax=Brassica TaxID=3705 RepID=A0A078ILI2_BRANA|nr:BnaC03g66020D [Brassica napus]VDD35788.1 unnamed protein product [Brassica oleracea]
MSFVNNLLRLDPLSPSSNVSAFHYYVLNSDLLRDYPIPSTGKQSIDLFASHSNRLKVFTKEFAVIFSIYYLSDMDDVDKRMEHEIDSGEVAHAKAVSDDQRERLAMSVERLCLEIELESRKTMMETEDLGVSALQDLSQHSHSKLYGSVNAHRLNTFRHLFSESSLYSISGFEAKPSNNKFKISYSPLYIRCVSSVDGIS